MDKAHEWTDDQLEKLERKITQEYLQAAREMHEKEQKALAAYRKEREQRLKAMDDTPEARREYKAWLESQAIDQARIKAMVAQLSDSAMRANERASEMSRNFLPAIFSENANMAAFEIDKAVRADTQFALVDESTVRYLMGLSENEPLIHEVIDMGPAMERVQSLSKSFPRVDRARDIRWNRQHFASAITQGILQGESVPNIVKRADSIYGMNKAAAVRAVRTATTAAENAGRVSSYERASALGIPLVQEWMATLDMRTRPTHKEADGQQVEVGEKFIVGGSELEYPGDPAGGPSETYNCRCTLRGRVKGFENYQQANRWSRLPDGMTYDEWKAGKAVSREESYENQAYRVSAQWQGNIAAEAVSTPLVPDIGMAPQRPRRADYASSDELDAARETYRAERDEFNRRREELVQSIVDMPAHGYETREGAIAWAERRGVSIANDVFEHVDARALDEAIDVIDALMDKYPEVLRSFDEFGGRFGIRLSDDRSVFMEAGGGLNFNPEYFRSYRDAVDYVVGGYTSPSRNEWLDRNLSELVRGDGTFRTSVTHEFGHNLDSSIRFNLSEGQYRTYMEELVELTKKYTTSEYSLVNEFEAFAEGFAEMECNPNSEYGRAFYEFLTKWR